MNESDLQEILEDFLIDDGFRTYTFEEVGILTRNKGLIVRTDDDEFQITIVKR